MEGAVDDDGTIPDASPIYRAIRPDYYRLDNGAARVSSAAFKDKSMRLSVGLGCAIEEHGDSPSVVISERRFSSWGLAKLEARFIRQPDPESPEKRLGILRDTENQPYWHGRLTGKVTDSLANKLADKAAKNMVVVPRGALD